MIIARLRNGDGGDGHSGVRTAAPEEETCPMPGSSSKSAETFSNLKKKNKKQKDFAKRRPELRGQKWKTRYHSGCVWLWPPHAFLSDQRGRDLLEKGAEDATGRARATHAREARRAQLLSAPPFLTRTELGRNAGSSPETARPGFSLFSVHEPYI